MWIAILGTWVIGSAVFYSCMVRSAKLAEDDVCSCCELKECSGCESCNATDRSLKKGA